MKHPTDRQLEALKILERDYFQKFGVLPKKLTTYSFGLVGQRIRFYEDLLGYPARNHTSKPAPVLPNSITVTLTKHDIQQVASALLEEFVMYKYVQDFPQHTWPKVTSDIPVARKLMEVLIKQMGKES
jgi:hypothetical protein